MQATELIRRLDGVRERGTNRWSAICPAHADKNPSLSIREGERGLLVHCWAGCTPEEICAALGLRVSDLFYDADSSSKDRRPAPRPPRALPVDRRHVAFQFELHAFDLTRRAEAVIKAATRVDISTWESSDIDRAINAVAVAYANLDHARLLENVADDLHLRGEVQRAT